jgi:hypothetical protein
MNNAYDIFLRQLERAYYTTTIPFLLAIIFFVMGLIYKARFKGQVYLQLHALASFLQLLIINAAIFFYTQETRSMIGHWSILIFLLIELCCVFLFIKSNVLLINSKKILNIIFISAIISLALITIFNVKNLGVILSNSIFIAQATSILFFVVVFYYEFFKKLGALDPLRVPAFLATTGIFFLISVVTPSSLLTNQIYGLIWQTVTIIINICYSILFLTYIKALLCKSEQHN